MDDSLYFTDQHLQVRDMVRDFARGVVKPSARAYDLESRFPWDNVKQMADLGLFGAAVNRSNLNQNNNRHNSNHNPIVHPLLNHHSNNHNNLFKTLKDNKPLTNPQHKKKTMKMFLRSLHFYANGTKDFL